MVNVTATIPIQLLDRVDALINARNVPSRSYVIREAVREYLKEF